MRQNPRLVIAIGLVLLGAMAFLFFRAENASKPDRVWGQRGVMPGEVARPRAAALDPRTGHLFLVDFTARIQCYDLDGQHLGVTWTTPDFRNGRPSGLGIDQSGNLLVADSHYHCVRVYDHQGRELRVLGGTAGSEPGQFGYVSDCVQDVEGNYFISEFGANDRITKLDPSGNFLRVIGKAGQGPGEFSRIRALAIGPEGMLYVVDACNHRIQVLTRDGEYVREFGSPGPEPGQLHYPYDLAFHPDGLLYIVERGNHRVQKFDPKTGQSLGTWGRGGRSPGQLADPWALVIDPFGRVHIVDTENHRVQRIKF